MALRTNGNEAVRVAKLPALLSPITRSTHAPTNAERLAAFRLAWTLQHGPQFNSYFLGPELGKSLHSRPIACNTQPNQTRLQPRSRVLPVDRSIVTPEPKESWLARSMRQQL